MKHFVIKNSLNIEKIEKEVGLDCDFMKRCDGSKYICYNDYTKVLYTTSDFVELIEIDPFIKIINGISEEDIVNSPNHYKSGRLETIENIKNSLNETEFKGYLKGNIIKYVSRAELKNGVEDLEKAIKCIEFLKEEM